MDERSGSGPHCASVDDAPSVTTIDGVTCGVSRGRVSDFLRVITSGGHRAIAMADGHTSGWDAGQVSLSRPMLDAVVDALVSPPSRAYRDAPHANATQVFEAARTAFVTAAEAHVEDELSGGPAAQLTLVELDGTTLRATWLAAIELSVFRGRVAQRVTLDMSPAIERTPHAPSTIELALRPGDLVTLSCRRWVGTPLDHARSDLLASLATRDTTPDALIDDLLRGWGDVERGLQQDGGLIGRFNLSVAALRV